ncbi:MAG TPA: SCO family protein [Tepidisphaeraceae bacterium]
MNRVQKILTTTLWCLTVILMIGMVISWSRLRGRTDAASAMDRQAASQPAELPQFFEAATFSLTDQDGKEFKSDALKGKVWICDFVFTHCAGPCPIMSSRMSTLQTTIDNPDVHFVSFSVDPERDTPKVLKEYGQKFKADFSRWHFLTGSKDAIFAVARDMKIIAKPAEDDEPILHAIKFLLVDKQGEVRGIYDSKDNDDMKKIVTDAAALAAEKAGAPAP